MLTLLICLRHMMPDVVQRLLNFPFLIENLLRRSQMLVFSYGRSQSVPLNDGMRVLGTFAREHLS